MRRLKKWVLGLLAIIISTALLLVGGEEYVKQKVAYPHSIVGTLMNRNWQEKYGGGENSIGYRDFEWTTENLAGKTHILVTGDSFADGQGIKDRQDRFVEVFGRQMGSEYAVMLAAKGGWNTVHILDAVHRYPYPPTALVMSYYINDILDACRLITGVDSIGTAHAEPPKLVHKLVYSSYLADYLYWNFFARARLSETLHSWTESIKDCFANETVWNYHEAQLRGIYNLALLRGIPLVVVVFPDMVDIDEFKDEVAKVEDFFTERDVTVINLTEKWKSYSVDERRASRFDIHPSELIHHDAGMALASVEQLRHPVWTPYTPELETLLSPPAYQAYQKYMQTFDLVPADGIVFMPATAENQSLELSTYDVNTVIYDTTATAAQKEKMFAFLAMWDTMRTEAELDLNPQQSSALQVWRATKNADDLLAAGIDYVFMNSLWEAWLTQPESDALFASGRYEIVMQWDSDDPNIYYRLLHVIN